MKFSINKKINEQHHIFCGISDKTKLSDIAKKYCIDIQIIQQQIADELDYFTFLNKDGKWLYIINCGKQEDFNLDKQQKSLEKIIRFVLEKKLKSISISLPELANKNVNWQLEKMLLQCSAANYQLLEFKTKDSKPNTLQEIEFVLKDCDEKALKNATAIADGIKLARDLGNLPANICTPTYLAHTALELDENFKNIKTTVLSEEKMQAMGMHSLLAVAKGSKEFSQLVEINYTGSKDKSAQPYVLVGKGITFDSGGISLKPPAKMEEMKYDMCGAASVLGTIKAAALMNLPINVVGILACAENMPGGNAVKPGDIVTSYSGQTIEITNTDAEGRLVLADALTYAEKFQPKLVIDIATLTGAVIIALGTDITGLMTTDEEIANTILKAADDANDKTWRLPIDSKIDELLNSPIADMLNSPNERIAGTIVAACFLSRFTKKYRWAHLDIAGTAWNSGKNRTATGRPVPLLIQILRDAANAN